VAEGESIAAGDSQGPGPIRPADPGAQPTAAARRHGADGHAAHRHRERTA
jgi:hypothetical protein